MSISIAIVEDLDEVREGLSNMISLSREFEIVGIFKDGEEAVPGILLLEPDIVIMDIQLPGADGIDCVRQLKEKKGAKTQFMMFTVYENDEKVFEALKAGATGYLLKSTGREQMMEALKDLHAGGSPMSANIARKLVVHFQGNDVPRAWPSVLSHRETEVLHLLAQGLLYKEIASQLVLSTGTVRQHIHNIYEKLHVQNRTEALNKAFGKN
jgi:DNA-binding NarL/FixJ family response regulator